MSCEHRWSDELVFGDDERFDVVGDHICEDCDAYGLTCDDCDGSGCWLCDGEGVQVVEGGTVDGEAS